MMDAQLLLQKYRRGAGCNQNSQRQPIHFRPVKEAEYSGAEWGVWLGLYRKADGMFYWTDDKPLMDTVEDPFEGQ